VLLRGNGVKAFCAGGEVRSLVEACRAHPGEVPPLAAQFFAAEYRLDYSLHTYPKPLICWGHGYVLGGGMGLLQGASMRIVTPSSRLAMPEISIGLYPDVGASWFLSRLPGKLGLFLGLTGAHMNGRDAIDLDLADRFLLEEQQELIEGLLQLNWQEQTDAAQQSAQGLATGSRRADARGPVVAAPPADRRTARCQRRHLRLESHQPARDSNDPLIAAPQNLSEGSPLTAHLVWEQILRARYLSLAEVFQMEYTLSLNCCRHPEFSEGVRARLIDKDQKPHWHWPDINNVPEAVVEAHFHKVWEGRHPLADLSQYYWQLPAIAPLVACRGRTLTDLIKPNYSTRKTLLFPQ
jgi:enoyl-CoA hydratase/carnithine racemase